LETSSSLKKKSQEDDDWKKIEKRRFKDENEAESFMDKNYLENGSYKYDSKTKEYVVYNEEPIKKGSLGKKAVSFQRGNAYVIKTVDRDEWEYDKEMKNILESDLSDDEKFDSVKNRVVEVFNEKADDENVQIKQADWDTPEIDNNEIWGAIEDAKEDAITNRWSNLKEQLKKETDPSKREQIQEEIRRIQEASKKDSLKKKAQDEHPIEETSIEKVLDYILMDLDMVENIYRDRPDVIKHIEKIENDLKELEKSLGLVSKEPDHEMREPEHNMSEEPIEKETQYQQPKPTTPAPEGFMYAYDPQSGTWELVATG